MAGAIIENMSTKKLCIVGGILLVFQIVAFLVGGLIAPAPTTAVPYTAIKCVDVRKNHHKTRWLAPWGPNKCDKIRDIEEAIPREIEANDIVFSVHIPLPSMEMSPWFQFMLFILQLDIAFKLNNQIKDPETNSTETSGTADSAGENTGSETQADSTDQNQEVDSSDSVEEENVNTDDTNTANEASEEDNKEELNDNSTGDNTSDQNSGVDNTETEDESNAKTKLENMKTAGPCEWREPSPVSPWLSWMDFQKCASSIQPLHSISTDSHQARPSTMPSQ